MFEHISYYDISIIKADYINNMKENVGCWSFLSQLQRQLKKQFLLVQKQQQQKIKLKRQIQQLVRSYHRLYIDMHIPGGQLLKEQGFDNCYNFIKDVAVTLSNNYQCGKLMLYLAKQQTSLLDLIINGFYQNLESNDPFTKDITKLMFSLMTDLHDDKRSQVQKQRIIDSWKIYMQKYQHQTYFQQIAYPTIKELLDQNATRQSFQVENAKERMHMFPFNLEIVDKEKILLQFIKKVQLESQLCLPSIKIPLRGLFSKQKETNKQGLRKIWGVISYFFVKPFLKVGTNSEVPNTKRERIMQFVDDLVHKWGFTGQLNFNSIQPKDFGESQTHWPRMQNICSKLIWVNEERMKNFLVENTNVGQIQIRINGGCLSLVQLHQLLVLINSNREAFAKVNERVVSRTLKIFQISPNLQVLHRERPAMQFVSLIQLKYEQSISSDYYKNYTVVYRGETLKQMLKQVLVETQNLWDLRSEHRKTLQDIFEGLVTQSRQYHTGTTISAQLQMKIRYLIYLLSKKEKGGELSLLQDLMIDLKERDSINIRLYEETKFSLLKVYCNLRILKNHLKQQKDSEKKHINRLGLIHRLQALKLDLCVTSKASRNRAQGEDKQNVDRYRYRLASADQILIQPTSECIHKDNVFTGRQSHVSNVFKFIATFSNLDQVRHLIFHPTFLAGRYSTNPYFYCNEANVAQALNLFIKNIVEQQKFTVDEKGYLESVMHRFLNQMLLGTNDVPIVGPIDRLLLDKIQEIAEKQSSECDSPRKRGSGIKRRKGSQQLQVGDSSFISDNSTKMHDQQLQNMGRRYMHSLGEANTPGEKVRLLRQMIDMYKIALGKLESIPMSKNESLYGSRGQSIQETKLVDPIENLLYKTILVAKPQNLVSQIAFVEMFLPEEKLMSSDGKVVRQWQRAVERVVGEGAGLGSPRKARQGWVREC